MDELNSALRQRNEYCKPIIPVFFKECSIPEYLRNICYADFREQQHFDASINRLVKGIIESSEIRELCIELSSHSDPDERANKAEELGKLKNPIAFGVLKKRLLSDENDPSVRYWIALAIGEIGGKKAINILAQAAKREEDHFVCMGIIDGMICALESLSKDTVGSLEAILADVLNSENAVKGICVDKLSKKAREYLNNRKGGLHEDF